jgi:signal transduction histidine kinase
VTFLETQLELVVAAAIVVTIAIGVGAGLVIAGRSRRRLSGTLSAASAIVAEGLSSGDQEKAFSAMSSGLARLFDADAVALALPAGDGRLACVGLYGNVTPESKILQPGEGLSGHAFTTCQAVVATDTSKSPYYKPDSRGMKSALAVPMRFEGKIIGAFNMESSRRRYRESDLEVILPIVEQVTAVVHGSRMRRAAQERASAEKKARQELQAVSAVVLAGVAAVHDLDASLNSMITEIADKLGWESMALMLFADDGLLHTRAYYGYPEYATRIAFHPQEGIVGAVARSGEGRLIPDVSVDSDYLDIVGATRSEMCMPLRSEERVLGVLNAESPRPDAFGSEDFELLGTLADQMAIVVERARLAALERSALERLRELDNLKDDFVATVSHELRTPLTSINGYAQTMLFRSEEFGEADRKSFLEATVRQCKRLSTLIESLLLVSQLETGDVRSKRQFVEVRDLITAAAEASGAEDRVVVEVEQELGLVSDSFRVHHILRNLFENASKYSPPASPVLVRARADEREVRIEVHDGGPGIPGDATEAVFERFRRLSDPGLSEVPGTGLGLYIARRFARDMGGDVTVTRSTEAGFAGACFVLHLVDLEDGAAVIS